METLLEIASKAGWEFGATFLDNPKPELPTADFLNWFLDEICTTADKTQKPFKIRWGEESVTIPPKLKTLVSRIMNTTKNQQLITSKVVTQPCKYWTYDLIKTLNRLAELEYPAAMTSLDNYQLWVNPSAGELFSVDPEVLTTVKISDHWHPADLERLHQTLKQSEKNKPFEFSYRAGKNKIDKDDDGFPIWFEFTNRYEVVTDDCSRMGYVLDCKVIPMPEELRTNAQFIY
jgi:hypothetical protein